MADAKVTSLSAAAAVTADDLMYLVDDPAGTPTSKKVTAAILQAYILGKLTSHISGLFPVWVNATQVGATEGAVYIESDGLVVCSTAPSNITPSVSANTWYHVYLYLNSGTPTLESSTTAPAVLATPNGTARRKGTDSTRRYLYSFLTNGISDDICRFRYNPSTGAYSWQAQQTNAAPFRVLSAGSATTATVLDCSAVCPVTSTSAFATFINLSGSGQAAYFAPNDYTVSASAFAVGIGANIYLFAECALSSDQKLNYVMGTSGGAAYVDIAGFTFSR